MTGDSEGTGVAEAADAVPKGGRPGRSPLRGTARRVVAVCAGSGAIALLGLLGWPTRDPFVYPPIGASAFMIFSMPTVAAAAPRNAICGQACGVAGGITAPAIFGLLNRHEGLTASMSGPRLGATAVALLLATALMLGLKVSHPAAGATALLIGLGVVTTPSEWLELLGAIVLICALALAINRLVGIAYPLWTPLVPVLGPRPGRTGRHGWNRRRDHRAQAITRISPDYVASLRG